jgi:uncharacterized phage-associated protein
MTICKVLYFADKEHLLRYGRPITGDHYHRLPHGPCPTRGLNMLRKKGDPAENALLEKYVSVVGAAVHPKQSANKKVFSKSDIEVLDWTIQKYGHMTATKLYKLSHEEPAYKAAAPAGPIDFALFFPSDDIDAQMMKKLAEEEQEARDLLRQYAG